MCAIAAAESAAAGVLADGAGWLRVPDGTEAAALLWQAVVVTVVGFVCWYSGLRRLGAERATLYSGLIAVAAAGTAPLAGTGAYGPARPRAAPWSAPGSPSGQARCPGAAAPRRAGVSGPWSVPWRSGRAPGRC
ncbi:hypothetical protein SFUMM280S_04823 [Streptomyces fumanus]